MKLFSQNLTISLNRKGVLDIDTVKGCTLGMEAYPKGGCYGICYAAKIAKVFGMNFYVSVSRKHFDKYNIERKLFTYPQSWFRIGTMGDPCHDWDWTVEVCEWLGKYKTPIIVSKSWINLSDEHIKMLRKNNVVINISISALDTKQERDHRLGQFLRLRENGARAVLRIVSVNFGNTLFNSEYIEKITSIQKDLFSYFSVIDNPLRIPSTDLRVICGDVEVERLEDLNGKSTISKFNKNTYIGNCERCPDLCGVAFFRERMSP